MPVGEQSPLMSRNGKEFPEPLSFLWRAIHNTLYLIGGSTFVVGSYCYFPTIANFALGGWMFTIGSLGFFFADLFEWWKNNRVGCFNYAEFEISYERQVEKIFDSKDTLYGEYQRAEIGLNFFLSFIGSTLYLIGSALYIPQINQTVTGDKIFIVGSAIIFIAQSWKLYRGGTIDERDAYNKAWNILNFRHDISGALVDLFAGLGGACYLIGSVILLPIYDVNTSFTHLGAVWYVCGGWCFFASGVCMFARYFLLGGFAATDKIISEDAHMQF